MTSSLRASMIFMIFLNIFPDSGGSNDFLIFFNLLLGKPKDIFPLIAGKITEGIVENEELKNKVELIKKKVSPS